MKCQNCGAELPDDSQFCNKCGAKVILEEKIEESQTEQQYLSDNVFTDDENVINKSITTKRNNTIKTILLIGIVCFLIVGFYFLYPYLKYNSAQGLLSSHQYDKAITIFTELKDYKDSPNQIPNCKYQQAKDLLDNGKYNEAIEEFTKLNNYLDSKTMVNESKYRLSKNYLSKCDYENAVKILSGTGDYKDSKSLLQEEEYKLANYYIEEKEYSNSAQIYAKLTDYKDSKSRLTDVIYCDAKSKYDDGSFFDSQKQFEKVKTYKDSSTYLGKLDTLIKMQGTWGEKDSNLTDQIIFCGWKVSKCFSKNVYNFECKFDNNKLTDGFDIYTLQGDELLDKGASASYVYIKTNANTIAPASSPEPSIGMTAQQVRDSQWGEPENINKTTTASTVHEQWVYSGNRYIYLDNGVVTAIQN